MILPDCFACHSMLLIGFAAFHGKFYTLSMVHHGSLGKLKHQKVINHPVMINFSDLVFNNLNSLQI